MPRFVVKIIVIGALIGAGYFAYGKFFGHNPGGKMAGFGAPPVSVAEVLEKDIAQWDEFSGHLEAVDKVEVRARVSGYIDSISFKEGSRVKKGDLLFVIDPRSFDADVKRAEANLSSAKAEIVLKKLELERAKKLVASGNAAQNRQDEAQSAAQVADANVKAAEAELQSAKLNLEYSQIKAPVDGRVGRAEITVGNYLAAQNNPTPPLLTTIVSDSPIYAEFEADEQTFMKYIRANGADGESLKKISVLMALDGETGFPHTGYINSFDNSVNRTTGTIRVRALFENTDGSLIPGMFARLKMGGSLNNKSILVTDRAIGTDQSKKFVMTVDAENKASYREIKLGQVVDGLRVVKSGLQKGDKIVVNGLMRVRPGMPVTPQIVGMDDTDHPAETPAKPE